LFFQPEKYPIKEAKNFTHSAGRDFCLKNVLFGDSIELNDHAFIWDIDFVERLKVDLRSGQTKPPSDQTLLN